MSRVRERKMRVLAIAAIITSLAAPAFAAEDPSKAEQYRFEEQKKKEAEEIERAYKDALKRTTREQPAKKTDAADPWRSLR
jgi:Tfp pilus assembly protein FimT